MAYRKLRGIYRIGNVESERNYVGSAWIIGARWKAHRHLLRRGKHHSRTLQRSWDKHGEAAFVFEILELVPGDDEAELIAREQYWIDKLQAAHPTLGFNVGPVAGSRRGTKQPAGHAEAISARFKGVPKSAEQRAKMSASALGRKKSPEHRAALSEAAIRQFSDPAAREAASRYGKMGGGAFRGRRHTEAALAVMSAKAKIRDAARGRGPDGRFAPKQPGTI